MNIYKKVFKFRASHFGTLAVLSFSLALSACDKDSYDHLPESTGNHPLTGVPPESGELLDQNIGLEGRWETYCERKGKRIVEFKGSEVIRPFPHGFEDDICTQSISGTDDVGGIGLSYMFTLKPPITTPSGLTAYPIELSSTSNDEVKYTDLIVLHENKLYWQEGSNTSPLSHPVDIDVFATKGYHELHRVE